MVEKILQEKLFSAFFLFSAERNQIYLILVYEISCITWQCLTLGRTANETLPFRQVQQGY